VSQYQLSAEANLTVAGGVLNLGVGLGKTLTTAAMAQVYRAENLAAPSRCWIVAPLIAHGAWKPYVTYLKTLYADVRILSIDSIHKFKAAAPDGGLLIVDECFPARVRVETADGPVDIAQLVNAQATIRVRTQSGAFAPITGWVKKPRATEMLEITHSAGTLICTSNHPVWTHEDGYVEAKLLQVGYHHLSHLPEYVRDPATRRTDGQAVQRSVSGEGTARHEVPAIRREDAGGQSDVDARGEGPNAGGQEGKTAVLPARGEREGLANGADTGGDVPAVDVGGYRHRTREVTESASATDAFEGRYSGCTAKAGSGTGRELAPLTDAPRAGRPQRVSVTGIRVVSPARAELAGTPRTGESAGDGDYVYCLNVAGHGNFYADGVLVHNCHLAGNMAARRSSSLMLLRMGFDVCLCLTGTLVHGALEKALTVLDLAVPGAAGFSSRWKAGEYFKVLVRKQIGSRTVTSLEKPTGERKDNFMAWVHSYSCVLTKDSPAVAAEVCIPGQELHTVEIGDVSQPLDALVAEVALAIYAETGEMPNAQAVMHAIMHAGAAAKMDWVLDQIDDRETGVVIFAQYMASLDHVCATLVDEGISFVRVDGAVLGDDRSEAVRKFQAGEVQVFVGQSTAAGAAINLFRANVSVCFDWSMKAEDYAQLLGRTCRRGQDLHCHHFDLVTNQLQLRVVNKLREAEDFHLALANFIPPPLAMLPAESPV
jgi:hypothetical protein